MKRYFTFLLLLVCVAASAQNINDVLRYSTDELQGTARFQGLSGAFGALGGDLSAIGINPAGSAVFTNSQFTISGTNYNRNNDAGYFNTLNSQEMNSLELNQLGGVFVFNNTGGSSDWKRLSLAFNYDMAQNFDNEIFVSGSSNQGLDTYFLGIADGIPFGNLLLQDGEFIEEAYLDIGSSFGFATQQAFLGYFGGIIDPLDDTDDNNTEYLSNAQYNTVNQEYFQSSRGYNSKFTANFAGQYQENLYLGASLNFHTLLYEEITFFDENGYDPASQIQFATFDNLLRTEGSGFSFTLGAIAKLNENVRLGASYQSPTWYRLEDDTSQRIDSDLADTDIGFIDFNIVNLFEPYRVKTPAKYTGSLGIIFGKDGLLSFDYSYQDMSQAELRPTSDPSFASENNFINNTLAGVSTFRVGGEYRINQVSLRGGYRFEESPYANGQTIGDLNGFSAGLGYHFGPSRLDLAFSRSERDRETFLYDVGFNTPATVNSINTNITLGYTMNF
jgi:hypothetical protein